MKHGIYCSARKTREFGGQVFRPVITVYENGRRLWSGLGPTRALCRADAELSAFDEATALALESKGINCPVHKPAAALLGR